MPCSVVLPGNPGICGSVPGSLEAVQLRTNGSSVLNATSFGTCSASSNNSDAAIPTEANLTLTTHDVLIGVVPK